MYAKLILITIIFGLFSIGFSQENVGDGKILKGMKFPFLKVKTLSGKEIIYPDSLKGKISLIFIAFERETQKKIDSWFYPYYEKYKSNENLKMYEIPMLKRRYKLMSFIIDGGMRRGIVKNRHDYVTTYYGDINKYKRILSMDDNSECYLFLLDREGNILWHETGTADEEKLQKLCDQTDKLLKERTL
ncbi:hypothetical protein ACFL4T_05890 [candidate division KSB1 bacterium]